jgi:regulatory protein
VVKTREVLILKGSRADAKTCALKLLSYRARSKKEMIERLEKKGFERGQIDGVVTALEKAGLIDDNTLASDLFRYSVERKSLGKRGINMFLARRGIDKELVDRTLTAHTSEMEDKTAREFVERKLKTLKNYPADVIRRRLRGMLQRRGFSYSVIKKTVDSIL